MTRSLTHRRPDDHGYRLQPAIGLRRFKLRGLREKYILKRSFAEMLRPASPNRPKQPYRALATAVSLQLLHLQVVESFPECVLAVGGLMATRRLAQLWWDIRNEAKLLALWFVARVPGSAGDRLRGRVMRRSLQKLGENTVFQLGIRITRPEMVSIGSNCHFANGAFITGGGGVRIGDWVGFGPDVKVWSLNHRFDDPDTPWLQQGWEAKPVVIEDDVWLAANVFVMPGVTIGKGAIVSAGAVVAKSIPAYAIAAGNPCRVVGWRRKPAALSSESTASAPARPDAIDEVAT